MKTIFRIISAVMFVMLVLLVFVYVSYVKLYGSLVWVPGILFFLGICFNWYLIFKLFNKTKEE